MVECVTPICAFVVDDGILSEFGATFGAGSGSNKASSEPSNR